MHDLQQLDDEVLRRLPEAALRARTVTLRADLKKAQERLHQNLNIHRGLTCSPPSPNGARPAPAAASSARGLND